MKLFNLAFVIQEEMEFIDFYFGTTVEFTCIISY